MRDKLLGFELKNLAFYQLELFISKGRYVDQCKEEIERRTGKSYAEVSA